ncbi:hypothetical protein C0J45_22338 [Silurus meridionalis]|nr:hypothetical protein C0J45_22338 [Silurus meridionalis]
MPRVKELSHTDQLKQVGFGRPSPRHGLHLLHWFCTKCLYVNRNDEMVSLCDPDNEDFGFHLFENRFDQNFGQLLPNINFPYYVVGNLNRDGAEQLPEYVQEAYTGDYDDSNKDRIIVSFKHGCFDKVYVTEHGDEWNYDPDKTYRINIKVIKYISRKKSTIFLSEMGVGSTGTISCAVTPPAPYRKEVGIKINNAAESSSGRGFWDYCVIL